MSGLLSRSNEMGDERATHPITSVIIVADKNRCPRGFTPITKMYDDQTDADLWKESSFSFFNRPVRYLAISRESPANVIGTTYVVTDMCVVKDSDPIPVGFIAIDFTADSKEKPLRKKFLCVRSVARSAVVDAIGDIIVLNRQRKPPKDFTSAGEIDGATICFKVIVIPSSFGAAVMARSQSTAGGLYPSVDGQYRNSAPALDQLGKAVSGVNALTIKSGSTRRGVEDVPFKLHPMVESSLSRSKMVALPDLEFDRSLLETKYNYQFNTERSVLANF